MKKIPRILLAFWVTVQLFTPTSFAESLQVRAQPSLSVGSFYIPLHFSSSIGGLSFEHQLDILQTQFPSDKYLIHSYQRKKITALSEISELHWSDGRHTVAIGRNYIHSGPTLRNSGLFSSYTPSLNHIGMDLSVFRDWRYEYQLIRLDDRQTEMGTYKRWMYYRRLQFSVGANWTIGLKDVVLSTGLQRGVDLSYLNPGAIFQLEQLHGNVEEGTRGDNNDNQMLGLDLEYWFKKNSRIYFDFILDEFQIDSADRELLQDVFGLTSGIEFNTSDRQIFIEYWFGSPWLYTNGGTFTNVEVNNIPLGYISPNAYGVSLGWSQEYQKYQTNILININKQGEQTVNTTWNSVDNRIPLLLPDEKWKPELDLRLGFKKARFLKEIRLTYNLLNSDGLYLILKFNAFDKQWSDSP